MLIRNLYFKNDFLPDLISLFKYCLVITVSFLISYLLYRHQLTIRDLSDVNGDAYGYIDLGKNLNKLTNFQTRTYGYPVFLWFIRKLVPFQHTISLSLLIMQFIVYVSSVIFFSFSLTKNKKIRFLIISSLLLNFYLLAYLPITLTDTFSVCMLFIACGVFWSLKSSALRSLLLGALAAFAVEVRPSNIWVFGFISLIFLLDEKERKNYKEFQFNICLYGFAAILIFLPQFYINYIYFKKITPLPAFDLRHLQYKWGKKLAHVSFVLLPDSAAALVVQNPFEMFSQQKFHWLTINGLSYLLMKIMLIFTHYTVFVYQYLSEFTQKLICLFLSFNLYFGFWGLYLQTKKIPFEKRRALIIGLSFCVFLHIFTALEDRFTLVICLLIFPFAIYQFGEFVRKRSFNLMWPYIIVFLFMNLFNTLMHSLTPVYPQLIKLGLM